MFPDFITKTQTNKSKILFIGRGHSTHTQSWINLLESTNFDVRLFSLASGNPPDSWDVLTYCTKPFDHNIKTLTSINLYPASAFYLGNRVIGRVISKSALNKALFAGPAQPSIALKVIQRLLPGVIPNFHVDHSELEMRWLAQIIYDWRPDIIHTFSLEFAGDFFFQVRKHYHLEGIGKWVLQLWGGSDITLKRLDPGALGKMVPVLSACDHLLSDNMVHVEYARQMGVKEEQLPSINPVPGVGGVDVDACLEMWHGMPSTRRIIVWPKAHEEGPYSKALPVLEALRLCWDRIKPCEIFILQSSKQTRMWFATLPQEIQKACHLEGWIPREENLKLMANARVLLSPSLVDGTPNSLYEAMACGAFPIISPLETITPIVEDQRNAIYARNLYPTEIADALVKAMNEDAFVDYAALENLKKVRELADRKIIRERVVKYYHELAK